MAKRKKANNTGMVDPVTQDPIDATSYFSAAMKKVDAKAAKKHRYVGSPVLQLLPVPSIAVRYLLQNEGWLLGRVSIVSGPPKSYKSTTTAEIGRWHAVANGYVQYCEAESKPNEVLRNSVFWWDTSRLHAVQATSVEEWQDKTTWCVLELQKQFSAEGGPGATIPVCFIVDSLNGQGTEGDLAELDKSGHISAGYPRAPRSITGFLRAFPHHLMAWPFSFIGVNHVKTATDAMGKATSYETGGVGTAFQMSVNIRMLALGGKKQYADRTVQQVSMRTIENSYGANNKSIVVPITLWQQPAEDGSYRLYSRFEWWAASTRLLCEGTGMRKADAEILLPQIRSVVDIRCRNASASDEEERRYYSDTLGVPSAQAVPAHDLGVLLEQRPEILSALYPLLGISRHTFFRAGVDYQQQEQRLQENADNEEEAEDTLEIERQLTGG